MDPSLILFLHLIVICVFGDETNIDNLRKDFEEFKKAFKHELASQKHCLENLFATLQPLVDQMPIGDTPALNIDKIKNISSTMTNLGHAANNIKNWNSTMKTLTESTEDIYSSRSTSLAELFELSNRTENLYNVVRQNSEAISQLPFSHCGGYVELARDIDIIYQIPQGVSRVSCIWVVWAKFGGPIRYDVVDNRFAQFDQTFDFYVDYNYGSAGPYRQINFDNTTHHFIFVHFSANTTQKQQGIHLKFTDIGPKPPLTLDFRPKVKFIQFERESGSFKYPPGTKPFYDNNERTFMIGLVPEGKTLHTTIKTDFGDDHDYLIFSWRKSPLFGDQSQRLKKVYLFKDYLLVPECTSYVIGLVSNGSVVGSGFQLNYTYNYN